MDSLDLKDTAHESLLFADRALQAGLFVVFLVIVMLLRLAWLQIVEHNHFATLSTENRVKLMPLPPPRGMIYDRKGRVLADNVAYFSLELVPDDVEDMEQTIGQLAEILEVTEEDRRRFARQLRQQRRFDSIPIKLRLTEEEVARFSVNRHRFPGVDVKAKLNRHYPLGEETSHAVGYVGRISEKELEEIDQAQYAGSTHMGKTGVEKYHEDELHGRVGVQQVEINAFGRVIRVLEDAPPVSGNDLYLSIDVDLQREALDALGEERGALVAIDPRDGAVLALVSKPGFDPNLFVDGISSSKYSDLQRSEDRPLFNRALRGQYPPGSTTKPFTALAGLEYGAITTTQHKSCPGFYQLPNNDHRYRDWKKHGHGSADLNVAIIQSCDVYFYDLAHDLGVDRIHEFFSRFGFGEKTGVDVAGEQGGLLPSREWKRDVRRAAWYPGETLILGIGQGYFLTTPMQLASATATLAADGVRHTPWVVDRVGEGGVKAPVKAKAPAPQVLPKRKQQNWTDLKTAMSGVVEGERGTARRINNPYYRIAGKTGTAQVFTVKQDAEYDEDKIAKRMRDHALFMAFAPTDAPTIAVAVIVENGGHGGSVAAPIARRVMDRHLLGEVRYVPPKEEH